MSEQTFEEQLAAMVLKQIRFGKYTFDQVPELKYQLGVWVQIEPDVRPVSLRIWSDSWATEAVGKVLSLSGGQALIVASRVTQIIGKPIALEVLIMLDRPEVFDALFYRR